MRRSLRMIEQLIDRGVGFVPMMISSRMPVTSIGQRPLGVLAPRYLTATLADMICGQSRERTEG